MGLGGHICDNCTFAVRGVSTPQKIEAAFR